MKSSLSKLRRFALQKSDTKDKIKVLPSVALVDELEQAAQDMQDMRNCYDSLLSAAAATANSAYEFSESLQEMGSCLMEKTSRHHDEENSKVLLMLGKVQLELQKLVDSYRSHIFLTITNPSESLLNELRTVEDMKRQCDAKRDVYEHILEQREKGKSKTGKGESFTLQQLKAARDEYDEGATLCVFRLKSLKQGQYQSLLTQAARHHAAQLNFFKKGLKSLEAVDAHVKLIAERQHIDCQFSGLEDNEGEDGEDGYDANEKRELSFDYRDNKQELDVVSTSRNSMEVDEVGVSFPQASIVENAEVNWDNGDHQASSRGRGSSFSAPIFPEKKIDSNEKILQMRQSSVRESHSYVLPTPIDTKVPFSSRISIVPHARPSTPTGRTYNLSHSSPLEQIKEDRDPGDDHLSEPSVLQPQPGLKESNINNASAGLPPRLAESLVLPQQDMFNASDTKKIKRQAFSGPLTSKPASTKPVLSSSGPITSTELPQLVSGLLSHAPVPQYKTSPKISPSASPPLVSSPRISELHELPRPPIGFAAKPGKSHGLVGHSAPLMFRNQEHTITNKTPSVPSNTASPLPIPPLTVPRSFSIPSSSQRTMALHVSKLLESSKVAKKAEDAYSPPLIPISLAKAKSVSVVSDMASQSGQIRGD